MVEIARQPYWRTKETQYLLLKMSFKNPLSPISQLIIVLL